MGLFDRNVEKKKASTMTEAQKIRQKYAIWNYYKKKNEAISKPSTSKTNIIKPSYRRKKK